jgi:hypothetical protein
VSFWGLPIAISEVLTNPLSNDVSTADTLRQMQVIARQSANSPQVRQVVHGCLRLSVMDTVRCLYWWIKGHIQFENDEAILASQFGLGPDKELIISPEALLRMPTPMGDCDCMSTLMASFLRAVLIPCRYVAIAADEKEPERFSHVYVKAFVDGEWITLDCSHGVYPGWEYSGMVFRKVEVNV